MKPEVLIFAGLVASGALVATSFVVTEDGKCVPLVEVRGERETRPQVEAAVLAAAERAGAEGELSCYEYRDTIRCQGGTADFEVPAAIKGEGDVSLSLQVVDGAVYVSAVRPARGDDGEDTKGSGREQ